LTPPKATYLEQSVSAIPKTYISSSQYLDTEVESTIRHEYINGEVYAMAGATPEHIQITLNIPLALAGQLYTKGCDIYTTELRVKLVPTGAYFYPDVVIVCGGKEMEAQTLLNPTVIIEILSDSTANYDRGVKWAHYQKSSTLQEYLLVSQTHPYVEQYVRQTDGTWQYVSYEGLETIIRLPTLALELPMQALYHRIIFG
jgi:Uma2 family endonuclease